MTDIEKDKASLLSRLDEAAMNYAFQYFGTSDDPRPSTAPVLGAVSDFKSGTRYGIEWVIEEMEDEARKISEESGNFDYRHLDYAVQFLREKFAPILERGRE